jgi:hypothetical protein
MFKGSWMRAAVVLTVAGTLACSQEKPAQNAITAAENALAAAPAEAQVYAANAYKMATDKIAAAKQALEQKDYKLAVTSANEATAKVGEFAAAIEAKKTELTRSWTALDGELPGMVAAIDRRVTELSGMRRLPAGITKASVDSAKASLAEMRATWGDAVAAHDGGNMMDAVTKATGIKTKVAEIMSALKM